MLKELVIKPTGGLGNRARVIASAMHVAAQFRAELGIVCWEGDLRELIDLPGDIRLLPSPPADLECYTRFRGKEYDFSLAEQVYYEGCYKFRHISSTWVDLFDYPSYIRPAAPVREHVRILRDALMLPDDFIAMHIRRGDHQRCKQLVTDDMVEAEIGKLVAREPDVCIALACEDIPLRTRLRNHYPDNVIVASRKTTAWGARFYVSSVVRDFAELLLLSEGRYIIGTDYSSYSSLMIAYNGNRESYQLGPSPYRYVND